MVTITDDDATGFYMSEIDEEDFRGRPQKPKTDKRRRAQKRKTLENPHKK